MKFKLAAPRWMAMMPLAVAFTSLLGAAQPHPSLPTPGRTEGLGVNIHFTDPRPGEMEMLADGWLSLGSHGFRLGCHRTRARPLRLLGVRTAVSRTRSTSNPSLVHPGLQQLVVRSRSIRCHRGRPAGLRALGGRRGQAFQGHGILWEIWNEPNIHGFWKPEPNVEHYTAMALAAARAIRDVAPGEAIIGPATSTIDLEFLEGCFKAGLLEWWDAVSVHPYRRAAPETAAGEYHRLRQSDCTIRTGRQIDPHFSGEWGYSAAWSGFDAAKQGRIVAATMADQSRPRYPRVDLVRLARRRTRPAREPEHHFGTVAHHVPS